MTSSLWCLVLVSVVQLSSTLTDTYVALGRPFWWTCDSVLAGQQGPIIFIWRLNGTDPQIDQSLVVYSNGTLYLRNVSDNQLGDYTCIVHNNQNYNESHAWLRAAYVNNVTVTIDPPLVMVNQVGRLVCTIDAWPAPTVTWIKDGAILNAKSRIKIVQMDVSRVQLQIANVSYADNGTYSCNTSSAILQLSMTSAPVVLNVYGPPTITVGPRSRVVPIGYNITFQCKVISNPLGVVIWTFENSPISSGSIGDDGTLRQYNVDQTSSGTYQCTWTNIYGTASSRATLTVYGRPQMPVIITRPSPVSLDEGSQFNSTCTGDGNPKPTITWIHPSGTSIVLNELDSNVPLTTDAFKDRASIAEFGTLILKNMTRTDAGIYTCVLANPEGTARASAFVEVLFGPYISKAPQSLTVNDGDGFTLLCAAIANPTAEYSWTIPSGALINISTSEAASVANEVVLPSGSLQVKKTSREHQGTLTCSAFNSLGSAKASAYVAVLGPPVFLVRPSSLGVVEGDNVTLWCQVDSNPQATVEWYYRYIVDPSIESTDVARLKKTLLSSGNMPNSNVTLVVPSQTLRYSLENGTSLKIVNVLESDAGLYVCHAANSLGMRFEPTILRVITIPKFEVFPQNQTVTLGARVILECYSVGIPVPTQRWLFNSADLQLNSRMTRDANGTLTIDNVQGSDVGLYTCHANNQAGQNSTSAMLQVFRKPFFTSVPSDVTATEFSSVAMSCRGNSSISLAISWYTSDMYGSSLHLIAKLTPETTPNLTPTTTNTVITSQGDLFFPCVQKTDTSWYVCSLENQDGVTTSDPARLSVNYAPTIATVSAPSVVYNSRRATLVCTGSGNPGIELVWVTPLLTLANRSGAPGIIITQLQKDETTVQSTLTIVSTNISQHGGNWLCRACNSLGCAIQSITLSVTETIAVVRKVVATKLQTEVSVVCLTTGLPLPEVHYMYLNMDVSSMPGHRVTNNTMYVAQGFVKTQYTCKSNNVIGETSVTFTAPLKTSITNVLTDSFYARITLTASIVIASLLPSQMVLQSRLYKTSEWKNTTYNISQNITDYLTLELTPTSVNNKSCSNKENSSTPVAQNSIPSINVSVTSDGLSYAYTISANVYDLTPGSLYDFRAVLLNFLGAGPDSLVVQALTDAAAPAAVTNIRVDVVNRTAFVNWSNPDPLNGQATDIDVAIGVLDSASSPVKEMTISVLNSPGASFTNLSVGNYFLQVYATNRKTNKRSNVTTLGFQVTEQLPNLFPEIAGIRALSSHSIEVNWTLAKISEDLLKSITGYVIQVSSADETFSVNVSSVNMTTWVVQKLSEHKRYTVRVACRALSGTGPFSLPASVTTPYTPFSVGPLEDTSMRATLAWKLLVIVLVCVCAAVLIIVSVVVLAHQRKLARCKSVDLRHDQNRMLDVRDEISEARSEVEGYNNDRIR